MAAAVADLGTGLLGRHRPMGLAASESETSCWESIAVAEDQQTERWTIYKRTNGQLHAAIAKQPYEGTIVGPDTAQVEVVPAQVAERLAEAAERFRVAASNAIEVICDEGEPEYDMAESDLIAALAAFRSGSSKEGQ